MVKEEKGHLLERCNKLCAEMRKLQKKCGENKSTSDISKPTYKEVENLQYDLMKQKFGLMALNKPYTHSGIGFVFIF